MSTRPTLWALELVAVVALSWSAGAEAQDGDALDPPPESPSAAPEEVLPPEGWGAPAEEPEVPPPDAWGPAPEPDPEPPPPESDPEPLPPEVEVGVDVEVETDVDDADELDAELEVPSAARVQHDFGFGSYGRVGPGTDLQGSTARPVSVVTHAPRVVEAPYLELDLYYTLTVDDEWDLRTVTTLAFTEDFFHYTGDFSSMLALRNAYAEFTYQDTFFVWAGSRMYRGDDIYLLDYWPMDNLNTMGGGVGMRRDRLEVRLHAGVNRLTDEFQFQQISVPGRLFGAEQVVFMDRQRFIASLGGQYRLLGDAAGPALKLKVYFEFHGLPDGTMQREDRLTEDLPNDFGWVGGLQLGAWGFGERASHANLFIRFGQGLGAYNEMAIPYGLDADKRSFPRASELVIGLSANYEIGRFGIMGGGYLRRFVDADPNLNDEDDGWELVLDVRPTFVVWGPIQIALDVSYQQRFPSGMSPTELALLNPAIFQVAPMVIFAPLGAGSYVRPHIRLVYRYGYMNEGALDTFAQEDPRHDEPHVHDLGLQAEWWFNSSYR